MTREDAHQLATRLANETGRPYSVCGWDYGYGMKYTVIGWEPGDPRLAGFLEVVRPEKREEGQDG